ncbi:hypothetical protein J2X31_003610 [Flavobacterium arsenatis]|uniref:Uncharacterized protein n=1 Tax=Flavobacterium arsenatis TaxID=1484332 RepID=A0ABU1TUL8_9FLAO|nr:hypothetical protein [Flavobacterium arsenatis]MDR6969577.1 hypothetical protein [Flavobacterium arsenatis]
MSLDKLALTLENFREATLTCERYVYGKIERRTNPISLTEIPEIKLSPELDFLYSNYDFDLTVGNNIALTRFDQLVKRQHGFSTFSTDGGNTQIPDPKWTSGWAVIADINDDPIVANTNISGTPILAAIEAVDYLEIAPSLSIFFQILTELLKSSQLHRENEPDDEEELITYNENVVQPYFLKQVSAILNEEQLENIETFLFS